MRVRDAYANLALPAILRRHRLRDRDAALATELGYGTLRARGLLDAVIDECTDRPLVRVEPTAARRAAPRRLPAAAHPGAAARRRRHHRGAGAGGGGQPAPQASSTRCCAGWGSATRRRGCSSSRRTPSTIPWATWRSRTPTRGGSRRRSPTRSAATAELDEALAADDARPAVHLLARPGEITAEELALVTGGTEAPYSPYGVHLEPGGGDVGDLDAVRGRAGHRAGRGQPARGARAHPGAPARRGRRALARPVRRTGREVGAARVAARRSTAARLDAVEPSEHRADLVRRATDGLPVDVHTADGREAPLPDGGYDRVLVDAPCTGLGALRRRPEARWRRRPDDVAALAKLQRELLTAALRHVRPGGVVAYVTCSPHLAETAGVLRRRTAQARRRGTARRAPDAARGARTSVTARPCSCGRTGTAPTRCSWGCCADRARNLLPCLR